MLHDELEDLEERYLKGGKRLAEVENQIALLTRRKRTLFEDISMLQSFFNTFHTVKKFIASLPVKE